MNWNELTFLEGLGLLVFTALATFGMCFLIHWVDMLFWRFRRRRQLAAIFRDYWENKRP